jgi:hypothetical protein
MHRAENAEVTKTGKPHDVPQSAGMSLLDEKNILASEDG